MSSSWLVPNYANPEVPGHAMLPVAVVSIICSVTIVSLRLYTRGRLLHFVGVDDYLIIPALFLAIATTIAGVFSIRKGWGRHIWDIPFENMGILLLMSWLNELLFTMGISFVKLSILFFYLRFAVVGSMFRRLTIFMIVAVSLWVFSMSTVIIFQCVPVHRYWTNSLTDTTGCLATHSVNVLFIFHGITSTLFDIIIFVLPLDMLRNLQIPRAQKLSLIGLFGMGAFVCVGDMFRVIYIVKTRKSWDAQTWEAYYLVIVTSLSMHIAILCASVPVCKPFFIKVVPGFRHLITFSRSAVLPSKMTESATHLSARSANRDMMLEENVIKVRHSVTISSHDDF